MPPTRCFFQISGQWYALMNWQAQVSTGDAVVFQVLSPHDVEIMHMLRQQGMNEPRIFSRLFPPRALQHRSPLVRVPISLLTKAQLVHVITHRLGTHLPSLIRMRKSDLQTLLRHVQATP